MLGARNSSQIDEFCTRGKHKDLDVHYISQNYFALLRQSIRNNSDKLILLKQILRDVQSMYYDIGAYNMKYDDFKEMCHKTWSERFNYLCIDMAESKNEGKYRFFKELKTTYLECIPESELFYKINVVFNWKRRRFESFERVSIVIKSCKSCQITR